MSKKLTLEIEMLLPTQVTKEVELPMYLYDERQKIYIMYSENNGSKYSPFIRHELKIYDDNDIRLWIFTEDQKQLERLIASIGENISEITKEEFCEVYKAFTQLTLNFYNELIK